MGLIWLYYQWKTEGKYTSSIPLLLSYVKKRKSYLIKHLCNQGIKPYPLQLMCKPFYK